MIRFALTFPAMLAAVCFLVLTIAEAKEIFGGKSRR